MLLDLIPDTSKAEWWQLCAAVRRKNVSCCEKECVPIKNGCCPRGRKEWVVVGLRMELSCRGETIPRPTVERERRTKNARGVCCNRDEAVKRTSRLADQKYRARVVVVAVPQVGSGSKKSRMHAPRRGDVKEGAASLRLFPSHRHIPCHKPSQCVHPGAKTQVPPKKRTKK